MDQDIKKGLIIGASIVGGILALLLFWKAILALGIIVSIVCWLFSGSGGGSEYGGYQQPPPNSSLAEIQAYQARYQANAAAFKANQDAEFAAMAARNGRGAIGTASTNTYPVGSMWKEGVRTHPSTGRQMGTDVSYGGSYAGTYSNRGVYTWDPDGRTVYGD